MSKCDGNGPGAGAHIQNSGTAEDRRVGESLLHKKLRLRPRNKHIAVHMERQAVKLCLAGDVLDRFPGKSALDKIAKRCGSIRLDRLVIVCDQPGEIRFGRSLPQRVQEQSLGVATRALRVWALGKKFFGCVEREAEGRLCVGRGGHLAKSSS